MKLGVTLHCYAPDIQRHNMGIDEAIRHAAGIGAKSIEIVDAVHFLDWPHPKLADLFHIKELIESLDMELVNLSQFTENEYSADYDCTEKDKINQVKESILYAHILGTPMTRLTPFMNVDPASNRVIEKSLPFAESYAVKLCVELQSPDRPDKYLEAIRRFDSEYFGLLIDCSAWYHAGGLSIESFKECLPYTMLLHGKAREFVNEGDDEPNIPYRDLFKALKDFQYEGSMMAEYVPLDGSPPELFNTRKGTEKLFNYLNKLLHV